MSGATYQGQMASFTANVAMAEEIRVKLTASSTTSPIEVEPAGAGEDSIGTTKHPSALGELVTVRLDGPGTQKAVAADTFAAGAALYGAANGTVSDTVSGASIGVALKAASAANEVIEFLPAGN